MIANLLRYFAKKSHNVRVQLLLATMYGLVSIYGVTGAFTILMKARRLVKQPRKRVQPKPPTTNVTV
jgi:hypothetical protein